MNENSSCGKFWMNGTLRNPARLVMHTAQNAYGTVLAAGYLRTGAQRPHSLIVQNIPASVPRNGHFGCSKYAVARPPHTVGSRGHAGSGDSELTDRVHTRGCFTNKHHYSRSHRICTGSTWSIIRLSRPRSLASPSIAPASHGFWCIFRSACCEMITCCPPILSRTVHPLAEYQAFRN
ncbi:hypothetical protein FKP32DRAFT_1227092 [Trametes sanguinea]|nr:hypothetical protein FKP32DRAFT_1227092 [Trametes sanguinea]